MNKLPPHSYTILPPLAAQLLAHFTPLWTKYPLTLTPTYLSPLAAQLLHHFTPSDQITPSLLQHFTSLGSPTLISFYTPLNKLPPHSYNTYPPWQPNYYIILPPVIKLPPHSYNILPPLAAKLLYHFTPLWTNYPLTLATLIPLGSPTITSFYPLWTN